MYFSSKPVSTTPLFYITFCLLLTSSLHAQVDCDNTSTGFVPINDLGGGFFDGYEGGLYPDGSNTLPAQHKKAGKMLGSNIKPLNALGEVDMDSGKIVFAAFGASTAGNTFNVFKDMIYADPDNYNPCLRMQNLCLGGKGIEFMSADHNWYYLYLDSILDAHHIDPLQVQVAWIKGSSKEDSVPEFPLQPDSIYEKYIRAIQGLKGHFPNLKILYMSSHAYGGYAGEESNNWAIAGEPAAYYGGYAVKWVIRDQIQHSPEMAYKGLDIKAPWVCWGPYFWADGLNPRLSDGLTWQCDNYEIDGGGFHLSESGKEKEANMMLDFFANDISSKKWFRNGPTWATCVWGEKASNDPDYYDYYTDELVIYPVPNHGAFQVAYHSEQAATHSVEVYNLQGQKVYTQVYDVAEGSVVLPVEIPDVATAVLSGCCAHRNF
ncbi:MAG: hypothetical protein R2794_05250 [Chitinophagales bacterium]